MERDVKCRVGLARGREHQIYGCIEPPEVDPEMPKPVVQAEIKHAVGAGAHRLGVKKRKGVLRRVGCHSEMARPASIFFERPAHGAFQFMRIGIE